MRAKETRKTIWAAFTAGFLCMLAPAGALAQTGTAEPELRNPAVVVTETRRDQAKAYMDDVMPKGTTIRRKGLPRWNSELCVSVIGPPVEQGQYIADRIVLRAMQVNLEAGAPGCDTNLLIIVTDAPEVLLPRVLEEHREMFGDPGDSGIDVSGTAALAEFAAEQRPVRWRQVIETVSASGIPIDGDAMTGPGGQPVNIPTVRSSDASRLRSNVRREVSRMIVVVDSGATAGMSLEAIADYLAFVSLTQVDPDAEPDDFPSILGLFTSSNPPRKMTDWDIAYLTGTYASEATAINAKAQLREIQSLIVQYDPEARQKMN